MDLHDSMQADRVRERLRFEIGREWKSQNRWNFTDAEMSTEIERRLAEHSARRAAAKQLELPLRTDQGCVSRETRRDAYHATRTQRETLCDRVRDLLEVAGANGMTRGDLAKRIGKDVGSVCQPVKSLIDAGAACEPCKQTGESGHSRAVVVLSKFARRVAT